VSTFIVARKSGGRDELLDIGVEYQRVDGSFDRHNRLNAAQRQVTDDRGLCAVVTRHPLDQPFTFRRSAVQARQGQVDAGFIDEAQAARIDSANSPPVPGALVGVAFLGD
jgi:hypothetical protein